MDKGRLYSGLFVMVGLMVIGIMVNRAVDTYRSYERTVDVKGLCEKEVKADKVIWPVVYKVMANDIQDIYRQIDGSNAVIMQFLQEGGIDKNEVTVSVPKVSDKFANEYGNNDRAYRYIATNVVTVCTQNVDAVLALMARQSVLLQKGIVPDAGNWENRVEFKYENLNSIKPEMIEEATRNARVAAEKFAKDSESTLGKIKTANQGTFTIENRDSNTPHIKKVRVVTYTTYYLKN